VGVRRSGEWRLSAAHEPPAAEVNPETGTRFAPQAAILRPVATAARLIARMIDIALVAVLVGGAVVLVGAATGWLAPVARLGAGAVTLWLAMALLWLVLARWLFGQVAAALGDRTRRHAPARDLSDEDRRSD
jgi:hypothetical protein